MTTRSTNSTHLNPPHLSIPREDQDVYLYSLRIAILDHLLSKPPLSNSQLPPSSSSANNTASTSTNSPLSANNNTTSSQDPPERPSLRHSVTGSIRPQEGWTNALLSLADTFKDSSSSKDSKGCRFPKEFVKVLDTKMERIAKGMDRERQDLLLRQTIGAYYGTYAQPTFQKKLKENRQIEEIILMFVTTASSILKKRLGTETEEWKRELNDQVGQFVGIIRDGLKGCSRVPGELVNRLDAYCQKLAEPPSGATPSTTTTTSTSVHDRHLSVASNQSYTSSSSLPYPSYSPGGLSSPSLNPSSSFALTSPNLSSSTSTNPPPPLPSNPPVTINFNIEEMSYVQTIGRVFGKNQEELKRDVAHLSKFCTEQAAFNDLKLMINTVAALSSTIVTTSTTSSSNPNNNNASSSSSSSPPPNSLRPRSTYSTTMNHQHSSRSSSSRIYPLTTLDFEPIANNHNDSNSDTAGGGGGIALEAWSSWKKQETDELQGLLLEMTVRDPSLVKNGPVGGATIQMSQSQSNPYGGGGGGERDSWNGGGGEGVGGSRRSSKSSLVIVGSDGQTLNEGDIEQQQRSITTPTYNGLTYVPPDPTYYFRRLYELLLEYDYSLMSDLPPDQDVSLSILSPFHESFLSDVVMKRWRVPTTTKASTFVGLVARLYKGMGVPEECVGEALEEVERVEEKWRYWRWPTNDRQALFKALSLLFDTLLTRFFEIFQGILSLPFDSLLPHLTSIHRNPVFLQQIGPLLPSTLYELETGMKKFVRMAWEEKILEFEMERDEQRGESEVVSWIKALGWLRDEVRGFDRTFPEKVCDHIDPPALFLSVSAPLFVNHLNMSRISHLAATAHVGHASSSTEGGGGANDGELLELYHGVKELREMHQAFCPDEELEIDFSAWFEPYVRRWLSMTDTQTSEWVNRAISKDAFEPEETATHSSSIVDLIESCKAPVDFILRLEWPNEFENAKFLTGLSRTIAKSIEQYSNQLESMFIDEMFPRKPEEALDQDVARPSAWLTKAKMVVQGDKKVEPFEFQAASCIKLNNIQAARRLLDTMYNTLDADKVSRIVEVNTPPPPPSATPTQPRFLFTVKIVLCENLAPPSGNSRSKKLDPFLILSDPAGYRVAKTRTLYETNDPRWDETLDVSVKGDLWLRATAYHRNLVDHHDHVGCAYIHLDPRKFSDFLAKDVWFRLEDQNRQPLEGRLLLRISMEGEKDDIRFYFGRAFRSLKRAEGDMVRTMVDKMSPFVRHYISHQNLKALLKTSLYNLPDLDKVRGYADKGVRNLNAYVRDALASSTNSSTNALMIPPVEDPNAPSEVTLERLEKKKKGKGPLTDLEIENAIGDLLDYFDVTFGVLKESLTPDAWHLVSLRLWKEILTTIEGLLVPPLSDRPTEMRPLSEKEVDVVYKWLGFLVNFFHGGGEGVPMEDLRNAKYLELIEARMYYEWSPDDLMRASVETMQRHFLTKSDSILSRSKSVYSQRNLGTIRARKIEKRQQVTSSGEMILRILRMHPGTSDFLTTQLSTMQRLQTEQAQRQQTKSNRGSLQRSSNGGAGRQLGGGRGNPGGLSPIVDR